MADCRDDTGSPQWQCLGRCFSQHGAYTYPVNFMGGICFFPVIFERNAGCSCFLLLNVLTVYGLFPGDFIATCPCRGRPGCIRNGISGYGRGCSGVLFPGTGFSDRRYPVSGAVYAVHRRTSSKSSRPAFSNASLTSFLFSGLLN